MPDAVFRKLYRTWISDSLSGKIATDVLAFVEEKRCKGLITYSLKDGNATIGLVAVAPDCTGEGIGTKLMNALFYYLGEGITVDVATQKANVPACRYYERNGFVQESATDIYHLWIRGGSN